MADELEKAVALSELPDNPQGQKMDAPLEDAQEKDNALAGKVRKETRERTEKALLEKVGVTSVDELLSIAKEHRALKESQLSATEKMQAELERAKTEASQEKQRAEALETRYRQERQASVIQSALTDGGAKDLANLMILLSNKNSESMNALFGSDQSSPDKTKLSAFVKQVQSDYPLYFVSSGAGSQSNAGGYVPNAQTRRTDASQRYLAHLRGK